MRGAARGLVIAAALLAIGAANPSPTLAQQPDFTRSLRDLDGGQFLEDEPIWVCDAAAPAPAPGFSGANLGVRIRGIDEAGLEVESQSLARSYFEPPPRAGELVRSVWFDPRKTLHPLDVGVWGGGGLRAGAYEVMRGGRTVARFRVVVPRASEAAVRAALARAARLTLELETVIFRRADLPVTTARDRANRAGRELRYDEIAELERTARIPTAQDRERFAEAARLYEAVFERYPRTSYVTSIYVGLWRLRPYTRAYADDPGAWLEAVFAHFHDACFGVWALDRYMADVTVAEARPQLKRLVGLYPDTRLSRAAARYL